MATYDDVYKPRGAYGRPAKDRYGDEVHLAPGPPQQFANSYAAPRGPRWHPRNWTRRMLLLVSFVIVLIIIAIIVGAVVGSIRNRYPDYNKLNYSLKDTYNGTGFFDNFDYFTGYDPTSGFVHYVDAIGSQQQNLTMATDSSAVLRVDSTTQGASTGRNSARISSKTQYNQGLFIFDIIHAPYGCGTWPALWLTDQANWPNNGEIDVAEAVNNANTGNQVTLHTTNGCSMNDKRKQIGKALSTNCYNGTDDNAGCATQGSPNTFGPGLNANGGGVYAMEWRTAGIRVWFFPRSNVPSDITAGTSPDPSSWGTALADFPSTDCNINNHFRNQSIVANIDLCGTWAGDTTVYAQSGCPGTCTDQVANNATGFTNAYWEFGGFRVFTAPNS